MSHFKPKQLLQATVPSARAAYSDRTAWLMAQLSKLAYFKFEGSWERILDDVANECSALNDDQAIKRKLTQLVELRYQKEHHGRKGLEEALAEADFELVDTFNCNGTQAFLAKREADQLAVLAFRGTEATQKQDILADLNVFLKDSDGSKVHAGFSDAFQCIRSDVEAALARIPGYHLYITGHSLGGALALIATRYLENDNTAACYTFGSPRVGSSEFSHSIKTPIYRVVNTADIVPRMPPGLAIEIVVDVLRFFRGIVPFFERLATWLDNSVSGYRHHGDMRYLTHTKQEDASDVTLIYNITFLSRWRRLMKNRVSLNRHIKDHQIDEYCKKLGAYALKRSQL